MTENAKAILRARMRAVRRGLSPGEQLAASSALCARLCALPQLAGVTTLLGTLAVAGEIDAGPFCLGWLAQGRRLCLALVEEDGQTLSIRLVADPAYIRPGYRNCPEPDPSRCPPMDPEELEAALVPGLAFDPSGGRLGQGGGHYDRFLARLPTGALLVGLAHDAQVLDAVPREEHDRPVHLIVTPTRTVFCGKVTR